MNYIQNNLFWLVPSVATIIAALLTVLFSKKLREKINKLKSSNIRLKKSYNNHIQIINNQGDISLKGNYTAEQTVIAYYKLFELTDGLIKLATDAFRPVRIGNPKTYSEYLNEVIDKYNGYIVYFDSKEFLFEDRIVLIINEIREIIHDCISHQKTIENYKSMNMTWDYIIPEIDALNKVYFEKIEKRLPILRGEFKTILKNSNLP